MRHTAFGLSIDSDIPLPALLPDARAAERPPDVLIRRADVPAQGLPGGREIGPLLWTGEQRVWLRVPGVVRFLVEAGRLIQFSPEPGMDEDSLRAFLLGSAMGALLFQRGHLVGRSQPGAGLLAAQPAGAAGRRPHRGAVAG